MTRFVWTVILGVGMCAATLPGCASSTKSRVPDGGYDGGYLRDHSAQEESEHKPAPSPRAKGNQPRELEQGPILVPELKSPRELPPGQRVLEFLGPPQVISPPDLPPPSIPAQNSLQPISLFGNSQLSPPSEPAPNLIRPLEIALHCLLNKQPAEALKQLQGFDRTNQECFMRLLPALALLNEKNVAELNAAEAATLQEQLQGLLDALSNRADLIIDKMCLCEKIEGLRKYEPLRAGYAFTAEAKQMVKVYVELRNIACERHDGSYVTKLNSKISVHNAEGTPVVIQSFGPNEAPLVNLERRSDCYRAYSFLCAPLPPGKYTLVLDITDETHQPHRVARKSVEFVVGQRGG